MQPAHGGGIDIFVFRGRRKTVVPLLQDGLTVGLIIPVTITQLIPFRRSGIVQQQWFAVRGRNNDTKRIANHLTLRMRIECTCTRMHGRCQHICLQTEQQLTDTGVGLGADVTQLSLIIRRSPGFQSPVLIIDEDATIPDRRLTRGIVVAVDSGLRILSDRHVSPPIPRRDTDSLRHLINAINGTTGVAAGNHQTGLRFVGHSNDITLPFVLQVLFLQQSLCNELFNGLAAVGTYDDLTTFVPYVIFPCTCHSLNIKTEIIDGTEHLLRFLLGITDSGITHLETPTLRAERNDYQQ